MNRLKLSLGGIGFELRWDGQDLLELGGSRSLYEPFCQEGAAEVILTLHRGTAPRGNGASLLFDAPPSWRLYRSDGQYAIELFESGTSRYVGTASLNPAWNHGEVFLPPEHGTPRPWSLEQLMRPLVQLILVRLLSRQEGLLVHGLGANVRGCGLAFVGPSGAGKSTLAKLLGEEPGVTILNDERIILRRWGGSFQLFGTPWPGEAWRWAAEPVPLQRIYFIYHAATNEASPLTGGAFLQELMPQLFLPFWNREAMAEVLATAESLLKKVPCQRLGFVNDQRIVKYLLQSR